MTHSLQTLKNILEGSLLAAGEPVSIDRMLKLFEEHERPTAKDIHEALQSLNEDYFGKSIELKEVASGFTFQVKTEYSAWIHKLWQEKPPRYSRALLETLALIAYRQPITRAEIEEIRGVSISYSIIKTLQDRDWIKVVGCRDVPGKPELLATTRYFLDYFNLKSLEELPTLSDLSPSLEEAETS